MLWVECGLTMKTEPQPTNNREPRSGTATAIGCWLQCFVRQHLHKAVKSWIKRWQESREIKARSERDRKSRLSWSPPLCLRQVTPFFRDIASAELVSESGPKAPVQSHCSMGRDHCLEPPSNHQSSLPHPTWENLCAWLPESSQDAWDQQKMMQPTSKEKSAPMLKSRKPTFGDDSSDQYMQTTHPQLRRRSNQISLMTPASAQNNLCCECSRMLSNDHKLSHAGWKPGNSAQPKEQKWIIITQLKAHPALAPARC